LLFLSKQEVLDIHAKGLAAFGGSLGLRDEDALESALIAAEQRHFYEKADLARWIRFSSGRVFDRHAVR